ncbi:MULTISPECIES: NAD-dependent epimerase/dehydratase family protein [Pseudonocardia]|uniref:UDP-glucose 4-epimerase n=2 Tax=Pseudonocardia TaxID=1847 RepID=A0A1Y2MJE6_PSEAH|nr:MULTISPECIES: NAD-dependent epimerase/dehydratase family protein [Pseudonocardia]OSY35171.1 UDP-glucose 4-epimerase [Pseudonocardia autotrophica]TDN74982.1 UDP-glucose 4-epimerase [Pseudonocardia autotrophica]BBF98921.1 putative UDP-glucose 4-epimerase GalE1 [Pseudonocardia autotrophica]GEC28643.1 putative UDP-glucose 4-epimerase GalE1 [Pseudonocardia saturnea]
MRALVTGGAGFIGSTLVDALVARGDEILVVDDLSAGKRENVPAGVELVELDIRDAGALAGLAGRFRPDAVYHLAAQIDVRTSMADPLHDASVNVVGTLSVLQAAQASGAGAVVVCSTGGAIYGDGAPLPTTESEPADPESPYGLSKLAAERYTRFFVRAHGLPALVLRFANVYGPRQHPAGGAGVVSLFCDRARTGGRPTVFGDGGQTRDFLFVGDIARAALAAADRLAAGELAGEVFNVGTGTESTITELAATIGRVAGLDQAAFAPEFEPARPGELRRSCLDPSRGLAALGLPEPTTLAEGLAATWAWHTARS